MFPHEMTGKKMIWFPNFDRLCTLFISSDQFYRILDESVYMGRCYIAIKKLSHKSVRRYTHAGLLQSGKYDLFPQCGENFNENTKPPYLNFPVSPIILGQHLQSASRDN